MNSPYRRRVCMHQLRMTTLHQIKSRSMIEVHQGYQDRLPKRTLHKWCQEQHRSTSEIHPPQRCQVPSTSAWILSPSMTWQSDLKLIRSVVLRPHWPSKSLMTSCRSRVSSPGTVIKTIFTMRCYRIHTGSSSSTWCKRFNARILTTR